MEKFSENMRRGRPRLLSDEELALVQWMGDRSQTRRHLHNLHYRTRAIALLAQDPAFAWVCDGPAMERGEPRSWKRTILNELGRIADPDSMRAVASRLCQIRPKTKEAVAMVRRFRIGKSPRADCLSLTAALERTVNEYLQSHPEITYRDILQAVSMLHEEVTERVHEEDEAA